MLLSNAINASRLPRMCADKRVGIVQYYNKWALVGTVQIQNSESCIYYQGVVEIIKAMKEHIIAIMQFYKTFIQISIVFKSCATHMCLL